MPELNGNGQHRTNVLPPDEQRARDDEIVRLTRAGLTTLQVAAMVGVSDRTVVRARGRRGITTKTAPDPLSEAELRLAKQLLDDGASYSEVARTLGRGTSVVQKHLPGRSIWRKNRGAEMRRLFAEFDAIPVQIRR